MLCKERQNYYGAYIPNLCKIHRNVSFLHVLFSVLFLSSFCYFFRIDSIQNLEENPTSIVIENNTFQSGSSNVGVVEQDHNIENQIHPVDQLMALNKEKSSLYERMLAIEKEKNALLEKLLKEK